MAEKYYTLATKSAEQFDEVHDALVDGSWLGRNVSCEDHKDHSPTKGEFLLTDEEANTVKADPRIHFINLTPARYPEIFNASEDDLRLDVKAQDYQRYGQTVKNWQFWANNASILGSFTEDTSADVSRASNQLLRCKQKRNPWISGGLGNTDYIEQDPVQQGAGEHVDVICMDNGTWIGHVEFINPNRVNFDAGAAVSPTDYVGGNKLPGNGYCDVLDVILDAPYYLDPEWFDADPGNRLTTRWDGTTVPVESVARSWWGSSGSRSASFPNFGGITVSSSYTRAGAHGSNTAYPSTASADHGTQCGSLIFGRTHGWAYNCNKWHLNLYGSGSAGSIERGFDICKIFHQYKPINPLYGTQDPTIGSNSWGYRAGKVADYYFFQSATGTAYSGTSDEPEFMKYMGVDGDTFLGTRRWKSEMYDNSMTQAAKELVESGFIFVAAAGNSGQMQVNPDDPNYDNHIGDAVDEEVYENTFSEFGYSVTGTTNRRGFPQHAGKTEIQTSQGNNTVEFPAINIGALDDAFATGSKERKVNYSDMGNAIDLYAPADGTLAATVGTYGTDVARFDDSYTGLSTSSDCRDTRFSGTSAACPVAAGFLATVIQYNRGWAYGDIRNWIQNSVDIQDSSDFYDDTRGTTAEGSEWSDRNRLQGGDARVAYLAEYPVTTPNPTITTTGKIKGRLFLKNGLKLKR
jgi:hypothetical protein